MAHLTELKYQAVCQPLGTGHRAYSPDAQVARLTTPLIKKICTAISQFTSLLILVMLFTTQPANAIDIQIKGVPKEFRSTLRTTLENPTDDSPESLNEFMEIVPQRARLAMQSHGYYNSLIKLRRFNGKLILDVTAGEPVIISKLIINVEGEARVDGKYMPVIGQIPLRRNLVFQHADYEKAKDVLFDRAQDRGYFDFEFSQTEVRVSKKNNTAEVTLIVDSGSRYIFQHGQSHTAARRSVR